MKYFPLRYRLHAEERYLIWISNEKDSVAVDPQGFVPSFPILGLLRQHAGLNHYTLESDEPRLLDLDWVVRWRRAPITPVDCEKALGAWNLFTDVAASIPRQRSVLEELKFQFFPIYDKLFWGNNLPAVTPKGKRYDPEWTRQEIRSIVHILSVGLDLFTSCVRDWHHLGSDQNTLRD